MQSSGGEKGRQDAEEGVAMSLHGGEGWSHEAKSREGVLLMISLPAVGLAWSEKWEGREEQWQMKQNELSNLVNRKRIRGGGLGVCESMPANIHLSV